MLNHQKVYERKGHLKDINARGPRCRLRGIPTCQGHSRSQICKLMDSQMQGNQPSTNELAFTEKAKQADAGFL